MLALGNHTKGEISAFGEEMLRRTGIEAMHIVHLYDPIFNQAPQAQLTSTA
jgi:hypothetical protein